MTKPISTALVAADVCVFRVIDDALCVYITKVKINEPYLGMDCLPGSLIGSKETAEETVQRVLKERTNLASKDVYIEQLYSFSRVDRDKRSRAVAVAYVGLMDTKSDYEDKNKDLGRFVPVHKIKTMAFDHKEIISVGVERIRSRVSYSTIIKKLIRKEFTFAELQKVYEVVLGKEIDKRNFRKKITSLNILRETGKQKKEGRMRPAMLYTWKNNTVEMYDIFNL
jgi:8-oxo-dGTP diphosphatase